MGRRLPDRRVVLLPRSIDQTRRAIATSKDRKTTPNEEEETLVSQQFALIYHRAVCQDLRHESMLMRVYSEALADQKRCPQEFEKILAIELRELRQDLQSVLN